MHDNPARRPLDEKIVLYLAENTSRSQFLSKLGKGILKGFGIALLPFIPVNRARADDPECSTYNPICGLCGTYCANLSGTCPNCATKDPANGYWVACCPGLENDILYRYVDCYSSDPNCACNDYDNCGTCTCDHCTGGCPQPAWIPTGTFYICTVNENLGACA
jgi:hypothetical protein